MSTTYTTHHYLIRALSNLHPGSGTNTFGIIDKVVQRDYTSNLPTIHASSLKGALREFANFHLPPTISERKGKPDKRTDHPNVRQIFGSDNRRGSADELQQGTHVFHDAHLLALPLRSSHQLFYLATTPDLLDAFLVAVGDQLSEDQRKQIKALAKTPVTKGKPVCFGGTESTIYLEDLPGKRQDPPGSLAALAPLLGKRIALLHVDDLAAHGKQLPTVARNVLNNGISENLWYEEIVPREARFYTRIVNTRPEGGALSALLAEKNGRKAEVQVGANATVGYGITEWTTL